MTKTTNVRDKHGDHHVFAFESTSDLESREKLRDGARRVALKAAPPSHVTVR